MKSEPKLDDKPKSGWSPSLILTALGFLTRFPMPAWVSFSDTEISLSTRWFSLIGLLVGILAATILWCLTPIFGQSVGVVIVLITLWLLTGGFHEDGLADLCDGFWGGWDKSRKLEIMKDSQIGTYGVLALIGVTAIKLAVLIQLPLIIAMFALIVSHSGGRAMVGIVPALLPYARTQGPSKTPQRKLLPSIASIAILLLIALLPLLGLSFTAGLSVLVSWVVGLLLMVRLMNKHIQGYTGDTLGATEQVIEVFSLLAILALSRCPIFKNHFFLF